MEGLKFEPQHPGSTGLASYFHSGTAQFEKNTCWDWFARMHMLHCPCFDIIRWLEIQDLWLTEGLELNSLTMLDDLVVISSQNM